MNHVPKGRCCLRCVHDIMGGTNAILDDCPCATLYTEGGVHLDELLSSTGFLSISENCGRCHHDLRCHKTVDMDSLDIQSSRFNDIRSPREILDELFVIGPEMNEFQAKIKSDSTGGDISPEHNKAGAVESGFVVPVPIFMYYLIRSYRLRPFMEAFKTHLLNVGSVKSAKTDSLAYRYSAHCLQRLTDRMCRQMKNDNSESKPPDGDDPYILRVERDRNKGWIVTYSCDNLTRVLWTSDDGVFTSWQLVEAAYACNLFGDEDKEKYKELRESLRFYAMNRDFTSRHGNALETVFFSEYGLLRLQNHGLLGEGKFGSTYEVSHGQCILALKISYRKSRIRESFSGGDSFTGLPALSSFAELLMNCLLHIQQFPLSFAASNFSDQLYTRTMLGGSGYDVRCHTLMPLYPKTLHDFLKRRELSSNSTRAHQVRYRLEAAYIVQQLAQQLTVLHLDGDAHADLHFKNVLIDERNDGLDASLCDFGLVKSVVGKHVDTASAADGYNSTTYYSQRETGMHTDLHSLGVIYSRLLQGTDIFTKVQSMRNSGSGTVSQPSSDDSNDYVAPNIQYNTAAWTETLKKVDKQQRGIVNDLRNAQPWDCVHSFKVLYVDVDVRYVIFELLSLLKDCEDGDVATSRLPVGLLLQAEFVEMMKESKEIQQSEVVSKFSNEDYLRKQVEIWRNL